MRRLMLLTPLVIAMLACGDEKLTPPASTATMTAEPGPALESGALSQEATGYGSFLVDLTAERWSRLLPSGEFVDDISPDGETMIFHSESAMFASGIDGSERRQIADAPMQAAFSADGDVSEIFVVKADGSGLSRITNITGYDLGAFRPIWQP